MRYPTISFDQLPSLVPALLRGEDADLASAIRWVGEAPDLELEPVQAVAQSIRGAMTSFAEAGDEPGRDQFEGSWSGPLHEALDDVPWPILDDPGFWRYIAVAEVFGLVVWRERGAFDTGDFSKYRVYVDGRRPSECVPLRMFLRGQIARDSDSYALASAVPDATDLWRSHIVRVRTGYSPTLAQGLLRQQIGDRRMPTDELRAYAKRLNRVAANVVLHTYDDAEVDQLLDELREIQE